MGKKTTDRQVFDDIMEGLEQAAAHIRGETVPGLVVHAPRGIDIPREIDVAAIRRATDLSQDAFARSIGVAVGTLRGWEQRRRQPEGPARVLLALIEKNPRLVQETLGASA